MFREAIFNELETERQYQEDKWGNDTDDSVNHPNDWVTYISAYATKWFPSGFPLYNEDIVDKFRESMIKTAAIAIAAVESIDRQRDNNGRTFYQA